jgi:hypothetical protein
LKRQGLFMQRASTYKVASAATFLVAYSFHAVVALALKRRCVIE